MCLDLDSMQTPVLSQSLLAYVTKVSRGVPSGLGGIQTSTPPPHKALPRAFVTAPISASDPALGGRPFSKTQPVKQPALNPPPAFSQDKDAAGASLPPPQTFSFNAAPSKLNHTAPSFSIPQTSQNTPTVTATGGGGGGGGGGGFASAAQPLASRLGHRPNDQSTPPPSSSINHEALRDLERVQKEKEEGLKALEARLMGQHQMAEDDMQRQRMVSQTVRPSEMHRVLLFSLLPSTSGILLSHPLFSFLMMIGLGSSNEGARGPTTEHGGRFEAEGSRGDLGSQVSSRSKGSGTRGYQVSHTD